MQMQTKSDESGNHARVAPWMMGVMALMVSMTLLLGSAASHIAYGQAEAPAAANADGNITPDEVNAVARELWCPLCSGVRLDSCELKACDQMKDVIQIKLSEGEDTESIKAYFVEQYGPQVMGEPPRQGFNWLAWILPVVALLVGGFIFWRTTQRMMQPATPLGGEMIVDHVPPASVRRGVVAKPKADSAVIDEDDEYQQKLEEELAKYG